MPAKIFIFIPAYNSAKYISEAIDSVLSQTFTDWELLIIDDASGDDTFSIAQSYSARNSRIKALKNESNLGMLANWNKGISFCNAPYFVKLDADDIWHPEILQSSLDILEAIPEVALVFTKYITIDSNGRITGNEMQLPDFAREKPFSCVPLVNLGAHKMLGFPVLRQGLSIIRKKVFDEIGVYAHLLTPETQASTDTEFYFRVGCHYQIYCIDRTLYYYRVHESSISQTDKVNKLQERKMYELKMVINDYYFKNDKISRLQWRRNKRKTEFDYRVFLVYINRTERQFLNAFLLIMRNFFQMPVETCRFYTSRLLSKRF
ncbi:MAG TPA: glycosyltransferase [Ohtaekwangia sp.]|uniref:glycosyltransferase family 2 protein n=1 Tax=Ohtaekwangia sp. TaxID=2066019 RepID=UPI002F9286BD